MLALQEMKLDYEIPKVLEENNLEATQIDIIAKQLKAFNTL
jgi:hypothetical protein